MGNRLYTMPVRDSNLIPGAKLLDGQYLVTAEGNVYSIKNGDPKLLKKRVRGLGYLCCSIRGRDCYLHQIVAYCFHPNPEHKPEINHIDGNKKNDSASNLEWCTHQENCLHAVRTGLNPTDAFIEAGRANHWKTRKLSDADLENVKALYRTGVSQRKIAKQFGVCQQAISKIICGKTYFQKCNGQKAVQYREAA